MRSCQLMVVGQPGLRGQPARSRAVQGNRSGLVHVPTHHRLGVATRVTAYHVTILLVLATHVQVSRWWYIYSVRCCSLKRFIQKHSLSFTCIFIWKTFVYYDIHNYHLRIIILLQNSRCSGIYPLSSYQCLKLLEGMKRCLVSCGSRVVMSSNSSLHTGWGTFSWRYPTSNAPYSLSISPDQPQSLLRNEGATDAMSYVSKTIWYLSSWYGNV